MVNPDVPTVNPDVPIVNPDVPTVDPDRSALKSYVPRGHARGAP